MAILLTAGLEDNKKINSKYSLFNQASFSENATKSIINLMEKENIKADQSKRLNTEIYYEIAVSKSTTPLIKSFDNKVFISASKSKEKNLEFIKSWANSESLPESPLFEKLAERLTSYGKK